MVGGGEEVHRIPGAIGKKLPTQSACRREVSRTKMETFHPMPQPSLRMVAAACGVGLATASRALSGHPRVHAETRALVQNRARQLGYERNHLVGALMAHVRAERRAPFIGNLAAVHVPTPEQPRLVPVQQRIFRSAGLRAGELGFQLSVFQLGVDTQTPEELARVLLARGVHGVIFLFPRPIRTLSGFPWQHFAAIEIDYGSTPTTQHTVVLDHHQTLTDALTRLRTLGYRRVGFFIEHHRDERIFHKWTAAFRSFQEHQGGIGDAPPLMAGELTAPAFLAWHKTHRLDVVIGHIDRAVGWLRQAGIRVPADTGYLNLNWNERTRACAGLDLQPELQGIVAVETLVPLVLRHERGPPAARRTIMVGGRWVDGPTLRQAPQ